MGLRTLEMSPLEWRGCGTIGRRGHGTGDQRLATNTFSGNLDPTASYFGTTLVIVTNETILLTLFL
jgi:hypothetical protein